MVEEDIKIMRMTNQHLITKTDPFSAIRHICGYQAQFFRNAYHSARIRSHIESSQSKWGDGLVKSWSLRNTVHIFDKNDLPLFIRRCLQPENVCESTYYHFLCSHGIYIKPERNVFFAQLIVESIKKGIGNRECLKEICYENGMTDIEARHIFNQWGGIVGELAEIGVLCFKVQEKKEYLICEYFTPLEEDDAYVEISRRFFTHMGPATIKDLSYFVRKPQKQVRKWMDKLILNSFDVTGKQYFYIPQNISYNADIHNCFFLAGFDQMMLGYDKQESLFLPKEYIRGIFNLTGIVFPSILLNGSVVGKWKHDKTKITCTFFRSILTNEKRQIRQQAETLWPNQNIYYMDIMNNKVL